MIPQSRIDYTWDFNVKNIMDKTMTAAQEKTDRQYSNVMTMCRELFLKKTADYGTAWRILRLPSITDQIWIKAARIRSIQEKGEQKVGDPIRDEFIGIINYAIIALMQGKIRGIGESVYGLELDVENTAKLYDDAVKEVIDLHHAKNHDYGEAWRDMRISSMVDLILQKLLRVKQIENNQGATFVSEGVFANYQDMMNYAVFCMIRMKEEVVDSIQQA